jgi:hypothetical protein
MPEKEDDIISPPTSVLAPFPASTPAPPSRPTIGSLLKQKTPVQLPGAPKKSKTGQQAEPTRRSQRIAQQTANCTIGDETTTSTSKRNTPRGSSVFRGYHPDYVEPDVINEAALLAQLKEQMEDDYGNDEYNTYNTLDSYNIIASAIQEMQSDPKTLQEVRSCTDWPQWKEAMDREIATLEHAETWKTVPRPSGRNIVGSKWVFWIKRNADGSIEKYKARLIARGFTQVFSEDYYDTFSPVAKLSSFQAVLALAAWNDWEIESFDFNGAYLNGELEEDKEIYMQPPPGYKGQGDTVKRLRKSLYGLKQAGRKWYDALYHALVDLGFRVTHADLGVFHNKINEHTLILVVHVDNCVFTGSSLKLIAEYKGKFNAHYALTDLGPISWLLGIKITRNRDEQTISLSQTSYIESMLERFALKDAKAHAMPMTPGITYSRSDSPSAPIKMDHMRRVPYREAIGSLMYASVATRPDITFAMSTLSQFLNNLGDVHWEAVKHIFQYLSGIRHYALTYGGDRHDLIGYTDADGATQEHRRAISSHVFLINGGAISWSSRKQELVTLSTAEAEYVAATHAAKEAIWLRRLMHELFPSVTRPTILFCDNQAALKLVQDDNYRARTKHIDIWYHFVRQVAKSGVLELTYCPMDDMTVDIFTKALPKWKASFHNSSLGLHDCHTWGGVADFDLLKSRQWGVRTSTLDCQDRESDS